MWGHGIPPNGHFQSLLYNTSADCLVAGFSCPRAVPGQNSEWVAEWYYRHINSPNYTKISGFADDVRLSDPVTCHDIPIVIFNVMSRLPTGGYDWHSLISFDLTTGKVSVLITKEALPKYQECQRVWISSLISASANGRSLIASIAFHMAEEADGSSRVEYWLCEIGLTEVSIRKIALLPDTFA